MLWMCWGAGALSKTQIVLLAFLAYLVIMVVGGAAYYLTLQKNAAVSPQMQQAEAVKEEPKLSEAELKAKAEKEAEEKKKEERRAWRSAEIKRLESSGGMRKETVGLVTCYEYPHNEKDPGVHLWPRLEVGERCVIVIDVYYYYTIHDPIASAWIFGDSLDIEADGYVTTISFNPEKRQKKMASDAEWLWERYIMVARSDVVEALRRAGNASHVSLTYYQAGGNSRSQSLTAEERQQLHDVMALYDVWAEELKDVSW